MSDANLSDAERTAAGADDGQQAATRGLKRIARLFVIGIAALLVLFLLQAQFAHRGRSASTSALVGTAFANYDAFMARQDEEGFVLLGRFDDSWPAKVVDEQTAPDEIDFKVSDGTRHRYSGFKGYQLKAVKLRTDDGQQAVIVLRSK
jgi:hypothetical protein